MPNSYPVNKSPFIIVVLFSTLSILISCTKEKNDLMAKGLKGSVKQIKSIMGVGVEKDGDWIITEKKPTVVVENFNESGFLVSKEVSHHWGWKTKTIFEFDVNNYGKVSSTYDKDGELINYSNHFLDSEGFVKKTEHFGKAGNYEGYTEIKRYPNGLIKSSYTETINKGEKQMSDAEFNYDSKGRLIERITPGYTILGGRKVPDDPMVVCLHGGAGWGTDNYRQFEGSLFARMLSKAENREKYPAFLFVPHGFLDVFADTD